MNSSKSKYEIITSIVKCENEKLLWKIARDKFLEDSEAQNEFVIKYIKENYYSLNLIKNKDPDPIMLYNKTIKKCV